MLYVDYDAREVLLDWIKRKQEEMIEIGVKKGISHEETLQCSQELDSLLTSYQRFQFQQKEAVR
ncbi:aspartyl-phosphate phosphatase Spo0E family protein [Alkalihalobacillus sp. CinArs1]|uniref:aspartyl-phosphate phosphatase Spo0E family protein n=1 Tax=Alkalihalobacillus sp. CinArs1 TaxID=2995314 RepID=UPI0022DE6CFD|nr:aspartyl-phosphate phosphatase Spo0E family protein [Alkalihalobacillus sp. CinArs1]